MSDEQDIQLISSFLRREVGLNVDRVPESKTPKVQRCDLAANDTGERYLIEVKGIHDEAQIEESLKRQGAFETVRSHAFRGRVAKEMHEATKQLRDTATDYPDHLWLAVLIARSRYDAAFMAEQIIGTIYGVGAITDTEADGSCRRRRCLYFSDSSFYKHRELDGVIVVGPDDAAAMHVNDYGPRLVRLQQSGLAAFFRTHNSLYDQSAMEDRADCLVADFEMDRSAEHAVLARLRQKYPDRNLKHMDWHRYEGIIASATVRSKT